MGKLYTAIVLPGLLIKHYLDHNSTHLFTPKINFMGKFTLRIFVFLFIAGIISANSFAQNTIQNGGTYKQKFDNMAISATATVPTGWRADKITTVRTVGAYSTAVTATEFIAGANMPSPASGGIYNFGAGTTTTGNGDRALGGLNTSNNPTSVNIYLALQNTGATITDFVVSYSIEKYRNGSNNDGSNVDLYYSTSGATGSWVLVPAFTRSDADDGNNNGFSPAPSASQTKFVSGTLSPIGGIAAGGTLYLAWNISVPITAIGGNASNSMGLGIDDVTIRTGTAAAPTGRYYRSIAAGDWHTMTTWESSTDNVTWNPAIATPDFNDETITVRHAVALTVASITVDQTYIDAGATLTINNGITLSVDDGVGFDLTINGTLTNNGSIVMLSNNISTQSDVGTASLGTSTGTLGGSGSETVQRFISAKQGKSAWRLLTAPLRSTGANGTIYAHWQNGGVNTAGVGTRVTGPVNNGGLDGITPGASMKTFDGTTLQDVSQTNNTAVNPLFTTSGTAANRSYFVYTDGDRNAAPQANQSTTLHATGRLQLGTQTFATSTTNSAWNLVGNPYASHIDLNQFRLGNTGNNTEAAYVYWDPYLTGIYGWGAYVNVSFDAGGTAIIVPQSGGTPGDETRFLQSGQAMWVRSTTTANVGTPTLTFTESQKSYNTANFIFRTSGSSIDKININLNVVSTGSPILVDGVAVAFDNSYSSEVDKYDASKMMNMGENLSMQRNGSELSVERRSSSISTDDRIYLNLSNIKTTRNYQLEINSDLNVAGLNAYLNDGYLKTKTQIDLNGKTTLDFTINGNAASTGANRFYITFAKPATTVATGEPAMSVFPNPVTNGVIYLQMKNMPAGTYNVRVFNSLGQAVINTQINHAAGNSTETIHLGKGSVKGIYQLDVVKPDNSKFSTKVVAN